MFFLAALPPFPQEKTGKQVFGLGFCSFPVDDTGICTYLCLSFGFPFSILYMAWRPCSTLFYRQTMLRAAAFTQSSFYPHMLLHRKVCAQRSFYTQMPSHTQMHLRKEAFTHRSGLFGWTCTVAVWTPIRLFASSSWSPTFRVPPSKFKLRSASDIADGKRERETW